MDNSAPSNMTLSDDSMALWPLVSVSIARYYMH